MAKILLNLRFPKSTASRSPSTNSALPHRTHSALRWVAASIILAERSIATYLPVLRREQIKVAATPWPHPNLEDAISRLDIHPLDECLDAPKHGFLSPNVTGQPPSEA